MIADNPIVDPRATVGLASVASTVLKLVGDLFYILVMEQRLTLS